MATIKDYRLSAGMSKSELCRKADVDFATLTKAETGEPIQEHNAQKIINALNTALGKHLTIDEVDGLVIYRP
jgi:transcriptional regulator with XRE-family HTH domain